MNNNKNIIKENEDRKRAQAIKQALERSMDKKKPAVDMEVTEDGKIIEKPKQEIPEAKPMKGLIYLPPEIQNLKKKDKCAIVGFAPSWYQAPWDDPEFSIFGINELYKYTGAESERFKVKPRYDAWFELHDIEKSPSKKKKEHQDFLMNCPYPLITQKHWDKYPTSIGYPRYEIKQFIGTNFITDDKPGVGSKFTDYSNQISWMIALAIAMGYREIHIYGVDMAANTEYNFQRASCQFFIGVAIGLGIKVLIPKSSELCKHYCDYGFESDNSGRHRVKDRVKNLNEDLKAMDQRLVEIEFYKDKLAKDLESQKIIINNVIKDLKVEREKVRATTDSNSLLLSFVSTAPTDLKTYEEKRLGIIKQIEEINRQNKEVAERIEKELTNQITKRETEEKRVFINIKTLENEAEYIKHNISNRQGIIGENKHLLSNNLI